MKKCISSILLITFTLQLCSCYSYTDFTYEEFSSKSNIDDAYIKYDKNQMINLTTDSTQSNYMKWNVDPDTLRIYSTYTKGGISSTSKVYSDTIIVPKNQISKVLIQEFDATKTVIFAAIGIAIVMLIFTAELAPNVGFTE